jgi:molecular chaperone DnaK
MADCKKALESSDVAAINRAADALTQASHKVAEAMYRSGAQAGPSGGGTTNGSGAKAGEKTDDVIDAEYVDTEEKKKE